MQFSRFVYMLCEWRTGIAYIGKDEDSRRGNLHLRGKDQNTGYFVREWERRGLKPQFFVVEVDPPHLRAAEAQWMARAESLGWALSNRHRADLGRHVRCELALQRVSALAICEGCQLPLLGPLELGTTALARVRAHRALYIGEFDYRLRRNRPADFWRTASAHYAPQLAAISPIELYAQQSAALKVEGFLHGELKALRTGQPTTEGFWQRKVVNSVFESGLCQARMELKRWKYRWLLQKARPVFIP